MNPIEILDIIDGVAGHMRAPQPGRQTVRMLTGQLRSFFQIADEGAEDFTHKQIEAAIDGLDRVEVPGPAQALVTDVEDTPNEVEVADEQQSESQPETTADVSGAGAAEPEVVSEESQPEEVTTASEQGDTVAAAGDTDAQGGTVQSPDQ